MKTYDMTQTGIFKLCDCRCPIQAANESDKEEHERFVVVNMVLNTPKRTDIPSLFNMVKDTKGRPVLEVVK